ncbi:Protein of unknown function [Weissella confusa LBAE C39-2]|nr:Protein of unknown function [Weissella confusa LBAE C39-2]
MQYYAVVMYGII